MQCGAILSGLNARIRWWAAFAGLLGGLALLGAAAPAPAPAAQAELAAPAAEPPEPLAPYRALSKTAAQVVDKLAERHYSRRELDDALSSQLLDAYLDRLDPGRVYLHQGDIQEFEPYRHRLDDQLRKGKLEAGFAIFNRYHRRITRRYERLLAELPGMLAGLDFERDESLPLDAEERPWPRSEADADERWRKQIKNAALGLRLAGKDEAEILPTLEKRYRNQQNRIAQYNAQDVFQLYMNALAGLYDPHTNYLSPRSSENFTINMSLSLEGIGAVLQSQDEHTKVVRIVPGGPAAQQGELQPSDRIVAVGQGESGELEDVIGWRLDEVVDRIRGPKGTTVRLEVLPANSTAPDARRLIAIRRDEVKLEEQSAGKEVLEIDRGERRFRLGVIDIPIFYIDFEGLREGDPDYRSTTRDVGRLLNELAADDSIDGVIVDLRGNGGGSLQEANELTGLFIEYGPTVQIKNANGKVVRDGKRRRSPYYAGPLLVMIDRLSASSSEIFTGAIQDYQRGIVVGSRSYGKGTVQTLLPLEEGQLKITESKFYRISGDSTQHRGVLPDVAFPAEYDLSEVGESALEHALDWDQITPVQHPKYFDIPPLVPHLAGRHVSRAEDNPDFIYLRERLALAKEARELDALPLNESARIALRDTREQESLAIENRRRAAKGMPLLESFDDEAEADAGEAGADGAETDAAEDAEAEDDDVLLTEAANILIDALLLSDPKIATRPPQGE